MLKKAEKEWMLVTSADGTTGLVPTQYLVVRVCFRGTTSTPRCLFLSVCACVRACGAGRMYMTQIGLSCIFVFHLREVQAHSARASPQVPLAVTHGQVRI